MLRKPDGNITKAALDWNPQGKRRTGHPAQTGRYFHVAELPDIGVMWTAAKKTAQSRFKGGRHWFQTYVP